MLIQLDHVKYVLKTVLSVQALQNALLMTEVLLYMEIQLFHAEWAVHLAVVKIHKSVINVIRDISWMEMYANYVGKDVKYVHQPLLAIDALIIESIKEMDHVTLVKGIA